MKLFSAQDIIEYYDSTEAQYRRWWKFDETLGLHYALWDDKTKRLQDGILNNNAWLSELGSITKNDHVLDAGCGVGGSAIYLAKRYGCRVKGVSLSARQVKLATDYAQSHGVSDLVSFETMDYNFTSFPDNTFDVIWGIEAIQTTYDKAVFFREVKRILKPGGRLLISDYFKTYPYNTEKEWAIRNMLHGWAISDIASLEDFISIGREHGIHFIKDRDVHTEVRKTVNLLLLIGYIGMYGSILYNAFVHKTSPFARYHHRSYYGQFFSYYKKQWRYRLTLFRKEG